MLFWQYTAAIKGWLWKFHCSWKMWNQGLVDNWKEQVKCPRQQHSTIPNWCVHNRFLSPGCSSTSCSDSDRESHGIMPQPHKMLKTVTNARYKQNLVMKVPKSKGHWWYLLSTEQALTSILCWLKLPATTFQIPLQEETYRECFKAALSTGKRKIEFLVKSWNDQEISV